LALFLDSTQGFVQKTYFQLLLAYQPLQLRYSPSLVGLFGGTLGSAFPPADLVKVFFALLDNPLLPSPEQFHTDLKISGYLS
jgi:hypothetical protein